MRERLARLVQELELFLGGAAFGVELHGLGSELALQVGHLLARGLRERCLLVALGFESRHAGGTLGELGALIARGVQGLTPAVSLGT